MNPERFQQVERLFHSTLERKPDERATYLREACAGDEELHREVESLLLSQEPSNNFIEELAAKEAARLFDTSSDLPAQIGHFQIIRKIGSGGMGDVYLASQASLGRQVALKVLSPTLAKRPEGVQRFLRESKIAAGLDHPSLVSVHEAGVEDGRLYIAMRYVEGETLAEKITAMRSRTDAVKAGTPARGEFTRAIQIPDTLDEATEPENPEKRGDSSSAPAKRGDVLRLVHLMERVARALHLAHEAGLIHRDIKPSNIMVTKEGEPVVLDFGLARLVDGDDVTLTQSGDLLGTPAYMSPEQLLGNRVALDRRTDVYSMGVTLFECLTLHRPFDAPTREALYQAILSKDPPNPRRLNPYISKDLKVLMEMSLEKDRDRRYKTALDFAEDLRRVREYEPIRARPAGPLLRAQRWTQRNPALAALFVSVVLFLMVIAVGSSLFAWNLREKLYSAYLARAQAGRWSGRPGRRFESLNAIADAAKIHPSSELRDEAIACMALADVREIQLGQTKIPPTFALAIDNSLARYAVREANGLDISLRRIADGQEIGRLPRGDPVTHIGPFSSDGRYLVVTYQNGEQHYVQVVDVERSHVMFSIDKRVCGEPSLHFDQGGRWLAIAEAIGTVLVYDLNSREESKRFSTSPRPKKLQFDSHGQQLVVVHHDSPEVRVLDLSLMQLKQLSLPAVVADAAWNADSSLLAFGCTNGRTYLWNTSTWECHKDLQGHLNVVSRVTFSRRGDLLMSAAWDGTSRLWNPWTGDFLLGFSSPWYLHHFSTDDLSFAAHSPEEPAMISLWSVASGRESHVFRSLRGKNQVGGFVVTFHPAGRLMAFTTDGGLGLLDLATRREIGFLPGLNHIEFLPDGSGAITTGEGLLRWPIVNYKDSNAVVGLGPPERIEEDHNIQASQTEWRAANIGTIALSFDGRKVCFVEPNGSVRLMEIDNPGRLSTLGVHPKCAHAAFSPDGRFVATGTWHGTGVQIWDVEHGGLVVDLPVKGSVTVLFSPDGKWLAVGSSSEYSLWEANAWKLQYSIKSDTNAGVGHMAFSPDSKLLALAQSQYHIQLVAPASGLPIAKLQSSHLRYLLSLRFSPDGCILAAGAADQSIQLWDLRRIRMELAAIGLDWDLPRYSPVDDTADVEPLRVEIMQ